MSTHEQKIVQYLEEAHATETALVRVLQSQAAMTPEGSLRDAIQAHLEETRDHAQRVRARADELHSATANPLQVWVGFAETVMGQALALSKTPLDLMRGTSLEEKVLKNAKDDCATEALEIATYTAIERLASASGDGETAALAASIIEDERRMLDRLLEEIPTLTDAVAASDPAATGTPRQAAARAAAAPARAARRARSARTPGRARSTAR
jgi:ferritin-like metal-binding protein YciE